MEVLTLVTATTAAGLLATTATRLVMAGWRSATAALASSDIQLTLQMELKRQTTHARMAGQAKLQTGSATCQNWRVVEVVELADESADCRSFYLQDPLTQRDMPSFKPGQFVLVRPALGGANLPTRCYSLSDSPGQPWWRVSVKRQAGQDPQASSLSNWLHDQIRVGDCLLVSEPLGDFTIETTVKATDHAQPPIVLLSAGIGVTPLVSMLKALLNADPARHLSHFAQVTDTDHWPFGAMVHKWVGGCENLRVHSYFSRLELDQLPTVQHGTAHSGKYSAADVLVATHAVAGSQYYICGPEAWMEQMHSELTSSGVCAECIHRESFAGISNQSRHSGMQPDWALHFARSGIETPPSNAAISIWQAAQGLGLELPAACHSGACGTCKLKLLRGTVSYAKKPVCLHDSDEVVACIAQAVGEVVIDA